MKFYNFIFIKVDMSVKGCTFVPTIYLGTYQHLNNNKMTCKVCIINFFLKTLSNRY